MNFVLVLIGGALGSVLRYSIHLLFPAADGAFPFNTLVINIIGGFVLGVIATLGPTHVISREWSLLLGVGLCGGFTTFSTFSVESLYLIQMHKEWLAFIYMLSSTVGGLAAAWGGYWVAR